MDNSYTPARVCELVNVLLSAQDEESRNAANRDLELFQDTEEAQRDFPLLAPADRLALRDALINFLRTLSAPSVSAPLLIQLSLTVAAVFIHLAGEEWPSAVPDLISVLSSDPSMTPALIEVLASLPEELNNERVAVSGKQRATVRGLLFAAANDIVSLQLSLLQRSGEPPAYYSTLMRSLTGWVKFAGEDTPILNNPLLVAAAFDGLQSPVVFSTAVDLACAIIRALQRSSARSTEIAALIVQRVSALAILYMDAAARGDTRTTHGLTLVASEAGETFVEAIIADPQSVLLNMLLACTASPVPDNVLLTAQFWSVLCRSLVRMPVVGTSREAFHVLLHTRLLPTLREHLKLPPNFASLSYDRKDDVRSFRLYVGDILKEVCGVLGPGAVLPPLVYDLIAQVAAYASGNTWREIESALYAIGSISRQIPSDEAVHLSQVFNLLPSLPSDPVIQATACWLIGRYGDWLREHSELLPPVISFLSSGLGVALMSAPDRVVEEANSAWVSAAAVALRNVCQSAQLTLRPLLEQLLRLYESYVDALPIYEQKLIIEGVAYVLSGSTEADVVSGAIKRLRLPFATRLAAAINSTDAGTVRTIITCLDALTMMFQMVTPLVLDGQVHPGLRSIEEIWPLFDVIFDRFASASDVIERLCLCIKFIVRFAKLHFAPFLPSTVQHIRQSYASRPAAPYLNLLSECVFVFGSHPTYGMELVTLACQEIGWATLSYLGQRSQEAYTPYPDILEEFMTLMRICVRRRPATVFSLPAFNDIFFLALDACKEQHREACRAGLSYVQAVVELATAEFELTPPSPISSSPFRLSAEGQTRELQERLQQYLLTVGRFIVRAFLLAAAGPVSFLFLHQIIDILAMMMRFQHTQVRSWVAQELQEPFPRGCQKPLQEDAKRALLTAFQSFEDRAQLRAAFERFNSAARALPVNLRLVQIRY